MKAVKILAAVTLLLLIAGASIAALAWIDRETLTFDDHQTFDGNKVTSIHITGTSIDINLFKSNDDLVHIDFTGQLIRGGIGGGKYDLKTDLKGEVLTVDLRREFDFQIGFHNERNLILEVRVPEKLYTELTLDVSSGDVQAGGLNAEMIRVQTSSGDIEANTMKGQKLQIFSSSGDQKLQNLTGDLILDSSSGEITLRTWTGTLAEATTSSGDQRLLDLTGQVRAHSSSGDVRIGMSALHEELDLSSSSGDVELELPDSSYFNLHYTSSSGTPVVDFPMNVKTREDHLLTADIGSGGPSVRVETSSGDLTIIKK